MPKNLFTSGQIVFAVLTVQLCVDEIVPLCWKWEPAQRNNNGIIKLCNMRRGIKTKICENIAFGSFTTLLIVMNQ